MVLFGNAHPFDYICKSCFVFFFPVRIIWSVEMLSEAGSFFKFILLSFRKCSLAATQHRNPKPQHPRIQQSAWTAVLKCCVQLAFTASCQLHPCHDAQRLEQAGTSHEGDGQHVSACQSICLLMQFRKGLLLQVHLGCKGTGQGVAP